MDSKTDKGSKGDKEKARGPIIEKIGEGVTIANLPIEIHLSKLLDWLVDRKKVAVGWSKTYNELRAKFAAAILAVDDLQDIKQLNLSVDSLNYWETLCVVGTLKTVDGAKNFLGQYSSKRMKDWDAILRTYEKDDLFLAEAAQFLATAVNYEIPALKKVIDKNQKQTTESHRKEAEFEKGIALYKSKFASACKELGIEGKDIKSELLGLVAGLNPLFKEGTRLVQEPIVKKAIEYYSEFVKYTHSQSKREDSTELELCPTLLHIHLYGNETVGEMVARRHPELASKRVEREEEKKEAAPVGINWDIQEEKPAQKIDWGIVIEATGSTAAEAEPASVTIKWIEETPVETEELVEAADETGIEDEEDTTQLIAQLSNTDTMLQDNVSTRLTRIATRNKFISDVHELQAFFKHRLQELDEKDTVLSVSQLQYAPTSLQQENKQFISEFDAAIGKISAWFTLGKMQRLLEIKNSKRYVERLSASIRQNVTLAEKLQAGILDLQARRKELDQATQQTYPVLEQLLGKVKDIKQKVEAALSKQFDNRVVNIIEA